MRVGVEALQQHDLIATHQVRRGREPVAVVQRGRDEHLLGTRQRTVGLDHRRDGEPGT